MNLILDNKWFSKWAWNLQPWKRSCYTLYLYKAYYFYEKLNYTVLCKDAIHYFMISSDPLHSILCTLTKSLSFYHSGFITWFLSLPQNVTKINNGQFSIKLHDTAVCDVLIFCILYFVGIFKCSLLFINKLKWKQKFVDDFYIVVLLLSSLLECMPSKFTMFSCWLTFETNKRKKRDYVAVILYILFSQSLFSAKLMNNVLQVPAV